MQQLFNTRNYSVRDFEEWRDKGELVLAPKFQRREVWNDKARSYLIDTILRGKPIPKLYMRQDVNPATRRTTREIVDGQQRLHKSSQAVLSDAKTIRNAVAHESSAAQTKFENLVRNKLGSLPARLSVGGFLGTTVPGSTPPESFLELYLNRMEFVATQIVPT